MCVLERNAQTTLVIDVVAVPLLMYACDTGLNNNDHGVPHLQWSPGLLESSHKSFQQKTLLHENYKQYRSTCAHADLGSEEVVDKRTYSYHVQLLACAIHFCESY